MAEGDVEELTLRRTKDPFVTVDL